MIDKLLGKFNFPDMESKNYEGVVLREKEVFLISDGKTNDNVLLK